MTFQFPKRGNRNAKRTEKHKNKMTHLCVCVGGGGWGGGVGRGVKAILQLANFTLGPDATLRYFLVALLFFHFFFFKHEILSRLYSIVAFLCNEIMHLHIAFSSMK